MKKRQHLRQLVIIIALIALVFPFNVANTKIEAKSFAGNLAPSSGLVQYLLKGTTTWENVTDITLINEGDQIRTANDGTATLNVTTGTKIDIGPNSLIELHTLLTQDNTSGLQLTLCEYAGSVKFNVSQALTANDKVQIFAPGADVLVKGTVFAVLVTVRWGVSVIGIDRNVEVTPYGQKAQQVGPNQLFHLQIGITNPPPSSLTADFLRTHLTYVLIDSSPLNTAQQDALRLFLRDLIVDRYVPSIWKYVHKLLGLADIDFSTLNFDQNSAALKEMLDAIGKADLSQVNLVELLGVYISSFDNTNGPLAPATCGNGKVDPGETLANCSSDVADVSKSCGDFTGQTDGHNQGETLVNCEVDFVPSLPLLRLICNLMQILYGGNGGGNGGGVIILPPPPSGVGGPH
jgi:hypothetical protein